jgi:biopolymer transport protein ExbB/TolQ
MGTVPPDTLSDPMIVAVLVLLTAFSVFSWTLLVAKARLYSLTRKQMGALAGPLARLDQASREGASPERSRTAEVRRAAAAEVEALESGLDFLATTAGATPFIGLFGTVWGIMTAFGRIGEAGSASLAIVAPGISAALVTTAVGLAVAVPALVGYNLLHSRCRRLVDAIDEKADDLLADRP